MKRHAGNAVALLLILAAPGAALFLSGYWPTQTTSTGIIAQQEQQAPSGTGIRNEAAQPAAASPAETAKPDMTIATQPEKREEIKSAKPAKSKKSIKRKKAKSKGRAKVAKSRSHERPVLSASRAGETRLAEEVYELTQGFTRAFDEGDLNTFLSYFSKSAIENNVLTYDGIRETYGDLFEKRLYRFRYSIGNTVAREKEKSVIVSGSFVMKGQADDGTDRTRKGTLTMTLERENGKLKIKRLQKKYD